MAKPQSHWPTPDWERNRVCGFDARMGWAVGNRRHVPMFGPAPLRAGGHAPNGHIETSPDPRPSKPMPGSEAREQPKIVDVGRGPFISERCSIFPINMDR